jgi:O-antigen/teichoic acid export membrane protein
MRTLTDESLVSNTFFSTITSGVTFLSQSAFFIILGRILNVDEFGTIGLAITTAGLISLISSYGFDMFVVREIAQKNHKRQVLVKNIIVSKLVLSIVALVLLWVYAHWSASEVNPTVFMIFGIADICWSFTRFLNSVLKADENFALETLVITIQSVVQFSMVLFFYYVLSITIIQVALIILVSRIIGLLISIYPLINWKKVWNISLVKLFLNLNLAWHFTQLAFPFALQAIFGNLYFQIDSILLAELLNTTNVGYYQASMRFVTAFMRIPGILMSAFYPRVARSFTENIADQPDLSTSRTLIHFLFIIGVGLTLIFSLGARPIIIGLYGEKMEPAVPILFVLSFIFVVRFVASGYGLILISCYHQWVQLLGSIIALIVSIVLNLLLVPGYGVIAAALASLITNMAILLIYGIFILRILKTSLLDNMGATVTRAVNYVLQINRAQT